MPIKKALGGVTYNFPDGATEDEINNYFYQNHKDEFLKTLDFKNQQTSVDGKDIPISEDDARARFIATMQSNAADAANVRASAGAINTPGFLQTTADTLKSVANNFMSSMASLPSSGILAAEQVAKTLISEGVKNPYYQVDPNGYLRELKQELINPKREIPPDERLRMEKEVADIEEKQRLALDDANFKMSIINGTFKPKGMIEGIGKVIGVDTKDIADKANIELQKFNIKNAGPINKALTGIADTGLEAARTWMNPGKMGLPFMQQTPGTEIGNVSDLLSPKKAIPALGGVLGTMGAVMLGSEIGGAPLGMLQAFSSESASAIDQGLSQGMGMDEAVAKGTTYGAAAAALEYTGVAAMARAGRGTLTGSRVLQRLTGAELEGNLSRLVGRESADSILKQVNNITNDVLPSPIPLGGGKTLEAVGDGTYHLIQNPIGVFENFAKIAETGDPADFLTKIAKRFHPDTFAGKSFESIVGGIDEGLTEVMQQTLQNKIMENRGITFDEFVIAGSLGMAGSIAGSTGIRLADRVVNPKNTVTDVRNILAEAAGMNPAVFAARIYASPNGNEGLTQVLTGDLDPISYLAMLGITPKEGEVIPMDVHGSDPITRNESFQKSDPLLSTAMTGLLGKEHQVGRMLNGDLTLTDYYTNLQQAISTGDYSDFSAEEQRRIENVIAPTALVGTMAVNKPDSMLPVTHYMPIYKALVADESDEKQTQEARIATGFVGNVLYTLSQNSINPNTGDTYKGVADYLTSEEGKVHFQVLTEKAALMRDPKMGDRINAFFSIGEDAVPIIGQIAGKANVTTALHEVSHFITERVKEDSVIGQQLLGLVNSQLKDVATRNGVTLNKDAKLTSIKQLSDPTFWEAASTKKRKVQKSKSSVTVKESDKVGDLQDALNTLSGSTKTTTESESSIVSPEQSTNITGNKVVEVQGNRTTVEQRETIDTLTGVPITAEQRVKMQTDLREILPTMMELYLTAGIPPVDISGKAENEGLSQAFSILTNKVQQIYSLNRVGDQYIFNANRLSTSSPMKEMLSLKNQNVKAMLDHFLFGGGNTTIIDPTSVREGIIKSTGAEQQVDEFVTGVPEPMGDMNDIDALVTDHVAGEDVDTLQLGDTVNGKEPVQTNQTMVGTTDISTPSVRGQQSNQSPEQAILSIGERYKRIPTIGEAAAAILKATGKALPTSQITQLREQLYPNLAGAKPIVHFETQAQADLFNIEQHLADVNESRKVLFDSMVPVYEQMDPTGRLLEKQKEKLTRSINGEKAQMITSIFKDLGIDMKMNRVESTDGRDVLRKQLIDKVVTMSRFYKKRVEKQWLKNVFDGKGEEPVVVGLGRGKRNVVGRKGIGSRLYQENQPNEILEGVKAIKALDKKTFDNTSIYDMPGGYKSYNYYEAEKLLPKPSEKVKVVTESNSNGLHQKWHSIANVDGILYGITKYEDPDAETYAEDSKGFPKEYVVAYARLDNPDNVFETTRTDIKETVEAIRKGEGRKGLYQESQPRQVVPGTTLNIRAFERIDSPIVTEGIGRDITKGRDAQSILDAGEQLFKDRPMMMEIIKKVNQKTHLTPDEHYAFLLYWRQQERRIEGLRDKGTTYAIKSIRQFEENMVQEMQDLNSEAGYNLKMIDLMYQRLCAPEIANAINRRLGKDMMTKAVLYQMHPDDLIYLKDMLKGKTQEEIKRFVKLIESDKQLDRMMTRIMNHLRRELAKPVVDKNVIAQGVVDAMAVMDSDKFLRQAMTSITFTNMLSSVGKRVVDLMSNITLQGLQQIEEVITVPIDAALVGMGWKKARSTSIGGIFTNPYRAMFKGTDYTTDKKSAFQISWDIMTGKEGVKDYVGPLDQYLPNAQPFEILARTAKDKSWDKVINTAMAMTMRVIVASDAISRECATDHKMQVWKKLQESMDPAKFQLFLRAQAEEYLDFEGVPHTEENINKLLAKPDLMLQTGATRLAAKLVGQGRPDAISSRLSAAITSVDNSLIDVTTGVFDPFIEKLGLPIILKGVTRIPPIRAVFGKAFIMSPWNFLKMGLEMAPLALAVHSPYIAGGTLLAATLNERFRQTTKRADGTVSKRTNPDKLIGFAARQIMGHMAMVFINYMMSTGWILGPSADDKEKEYRRQNGLPEIGVRVKWLGDDAYVPFTPPFSYAMTSIISYMDYAHKLEKMGGDPVKVQEALNRSRKFITEQLVWGTPGGDVNRIADAGAFNITSGRAAGNFMLFSAFFRDLYNTYNTVTQGGSVQYDTKYQQGDTLKQTVIKNAAGALPPLGMMMNQYLKGFENGIPEKINFLGKPVTKASILGLTIPNAWVGGNHDMSMVEKEFVRLGNYPTIPDREITNNKKKFKLTNDQYRSMVLVFGDEVMRRYQMIMSSPVYRLMPDTQKMKSLDRVYDKAMDAARQKIINAYGLR